MLTNNLLSLIYAYIRGSISTFIIYSNNSFNNNVVIKQTTDSQVVFITTLEKVQIKNSLDFPIYIQDYE
jgi:hypothetical protein